MECLVLYLLRFGYGFGLFVIAQWRNTTSFAQATPSRLGKSCRSWFRV